MPIDSRTWTTQALLRKVFKESGETFSCINKPSPMAQLADPRQSCVEATILIGAAILAKQDQMIKSIVEQLSPSPETIVVYVECDGTPEKVRFQNAGTCQRLGGQEDKEKTGIREVFVVNVRVVIPGTDGVEDVFCPPLVLGDACSGTLLQALMMSLARANLDLASLSQSFASVIWLFGMDAASTNELLYSYLEARLPANVISVKSPCMLHASNRLVLDHLNKSKFNVINPIFSMILLMQIAGNFQDFVDAVLKAACGPDLQWRRGLHPDADVVASHRRLLSLYLPYAFHRQDWGDMVRACDFWNCDWNDVPAHCCTLGEDGQPCCTDEQQFRQNARKHTKAMLLFAKPNRLCLSRWVKCVEDFGWFALGFKLHKFFAKAWKFIATKALGGNDAVGEALGDPADDDEDPNEDRHSL